jgi:hypothetical protein
MLIKCNVIIRIRATQDGSTYWEGLEKLKRMEVQEL